MLNEVQKLKQICLFQKVLCSRLLNFTRFSVFLHFISGTDVLTLTSYGLAPNAWAVIGLKLYSHQYCVLREARKLPGICGDVSAAAVIAEPCQWRNVVHTAAHSAITYAMQSVQRRPPRHESNIIAVRPALTAARSVVITTPADASLTSRSTFSIDTNCSSSFLSIHYCIADLPACVCVPPSAVVCVCVCGLSIICWPCSVPNETVYIACIHHCVLTYTHYAQ